MREMFEELENLDYDDLSELKDKDYVQTTESPVDFDMKELGETFRPSYTSVLTNYWERTGDNGTNVSRLAEYVIDNPGESVKQDLGVLMRDLERSGFIDEWGSKTYLLGFKQEDVDTLDTAAALSYFDRCVGEAKEPHTSNRNIENPELEVISVEDFYWEQLKTNRNLPPEDDVQDVFDQLSNLTEDSARHSFEHYHRSIHSVTDPENREDEHLIRASPEEIRIARDAAELVSR